MKKNKKNLKKGVMFEDYWYIVNYLSKSYLSKLYPGGMSGEK